MSKRKAENESSSDRVKRLVSEIAASNAAQDDSLAEVELIPKKRVIKKELTEEELVSKRAKNAEARRKSRALLSAG
jgi:hypothetical protein